MYVIFIISVLFLSYILLSIPDVNVPYKGSKITTTKK